MPKENANNIQDTLKWDVRQRLSMLEATLLWEGRATTSSLIKLFGISRGQASKDFSLYRNIAPHNMFYDLTQKAYLPSDLFVPCFIHGTIDEYLRLIEASSELGQSVVLPIVPQPINVSVMRPPARTLKLGVLRLVNQAVRERRQLSVDYQSMNKPLRKLVLSPHTLVFNGFRWHVRAFSEQHGEYRDFVLARIANAQLTDVPIGMGIDTDRDWQTFEVLHIEPHPLLSPEQREVIADDYGMEEGRLLLTVRKALSFYYLRMLNLDWPSSTDPKSQQIVLAGRTESRQA